MFLRLGLLRHLQKWNSEYTNMAAILPESVRMAGKRRLEPPRFKIGEHVQVSDSIATRHASDAGLIIQVEQNARSRTLDRYTVRLSSGAEVVFWDIQLNKVQHTKSKSA
jgi:hypothetical protein